MVPEGWAGSRKRDPRGAGGRMSSRDRFALACCGWLRSGCDSPGSAARQSSVQLGSRNGVVKGGRSSLGFPSAYRVGLVRCESRSKER